ncbi:MAG: hypothetical protein M0006_10200 [Magnetospirillum sp.]|nr:hypothetical protein [Magnetospirillum sp.]
MTCKNHLTRLERLEAATLLLRLQPVDMEALHHRIDAFIAAHGGQQPHESRAESLARIMGTTPKDLRSRLAEGGNPFATKEHDL